MHTTIDRSKFTGLYPGVPRRHSHSAVAYFDTPQSVVDRVASDMRRTGITADVLTKRAGIGADSLSRLLKTGVTSVADAFKVFKVLDIKPAAIPGEYSHHLGGAARP